MMKAPCKAARPHQLEAMAHNTFFSHLSSEGHLILYQMSHLLIYLLLTLCPTSAASSRSQCSLPDPHGKLRIRAFPSGPQQQALDRSVPHRTSTASSRSECSPPDRDHNLSPKIHQTNSRKVEKECQKICQKVPENKCQIECQIECQSICQKECQIA